MAANQRISLDDLLSKLKDSTVAEKPQRTDETSSVASDSNSDLPPPVYETRDVPYLCESVVRQLADSSGKGRKVLINEIEPRQQPVHLRLPFGADKALRDFTAVQRSRVAESLKMQKACVLAVENLHHDIEGTKATVTKWHDAHAAMIGERVREWTKRANDVAAAHAKTSAVQRATVEKECRALADDMASGIGRDLLRSNVPALDRAGLLLAAGDNLSDTVVSRCRQDSAQRSSDEHILWRLRDVAEDVGRTYKRRVEESAHAAMKTVIDASVRRARESLRDQEIRFRASDAAEQARSNVLQADLERRGIPYSHVLSHFADVLAYEQGLLYTRISSLV